MLKICTLLGCSASTAGIIMMFINAASVIGLIMSLTGVGFAAAAGIFAMKATLTSMTKWAAISL